MLRRNLKPSVVYTPARVAEEITRYYYYLNDAEKKILDAVGCAIVGRKTKFKNQLGLFVEVSYYDEIFSIVDEGLMFTRLFKIPQEIAKLGVIPNLKDYLNIPSYVYNEEPFFKNEMEFKRPFNLHDLVNEVRKDFNFKRNETLFYIKTLIAENKVPNSKVLIKVDSTISPAILIAKDNFKAYKKVRYGLNNHLIKEIDYL